MRAMHAAYLMDRYTTCRESRRGSEFTAEQNCTRGTTILNQLQAPNQALVVTYERPESQSKWQVPMRG